LPHQFVPRLQVGLTDDLHVLDVGYDVLEDVSTVRERDIDAEGDPISTDHLVRQVLPRSATQIPRRNPAI
jgi:hypothetical protein